MNQSNQHRILVIDDNPSIHEDFRKILNGGMVDRPDLDAKETLLFGETVQTKPDQAPFEIDSAFGGEEGLEMVANARHEGRPYALAFVDVRMPPGIDGVVTIGRMWPIDPDIQLVICSAYSDYSARHPRPTGAFRSAFDAPQAL